MALADLYLLDASVLIESYGTQKVETLEDQAVALTLPDEVRISGYLQHAEN